MHSTAGRRLQETLHGMVLTIPRGGVAVKGWGKSVSSGDPDSDSPSASEIGPKNNKKSLTLVHINQHHQTNKNFFTYCRYSVQLNAYNTKHT